MHTMKSCNLQAARCDHWARNAKFRNEEASTITAVNTLPIKWQQQVRLYQRSQHKKIEYAEAYGEDRDAVGVEGFGCALDIHQHIQVHSGIETYCTRVG